MAAFDAPEPVYVLRGHATAVNAVRFIGPECLATGDGVASPALGPEPAPGGVLWRATTRAFRNPRLRRHARHAGARRARPCHAAPLAALHARASCRRGATACSKCGPRRSGAPARPHRAHRRAPILPVRARARGDEGGAPAEARAGRAAAAPPAWRARADRRHERARAVARRRRGRRRAAAGRVAAPSGARTGMVMCAAAARRRRSRRRALGRVGCAAPPRAALARAPSRRAPHVSGTRAARVWWRIALRDATAPPRTSRAARRCRRPEPSARQRALDAILAARRAARGRRFGVAASHRSSRRAPCPRAATGDAFAVGGGADAFLSVVDCDDDADGEAAMDGDGSDDGSGRRRGGGGARGARRLRAAGKAASAHAGGRTRVAAAPVGPPRAAVGRAAPRARPRAAGRDERCRERAQAARGAALSHGERRRARVERGFGDARERVEGHAHRDLARVPAW